MLLLKYLPLDIEKWFKEWAEKRNEKTRGYENKGFIEIIKFFKSDFGQDAFNKWLLESTQKKPME